MDNGHGAAPTPYEFTSLGMGGQAGIYIHFVFGMGGWGQVAHMGSRGTPPATIYLPSRPYMGRLHGTHLTPRGTPHVHQATLAVAAGDGACGTRGGRDTTCRRVRSSVVIISGHHEWPSVAMSGHHEWP